jgi:hypothetical protein
MSQYVAPGAPAGKGKGRTRREVGPGPLAG